MSLSSVLLDNQSLPNNTYYRRCSFIYTDNFFNSGSFGEEAVLVTVIAFRFIGLLYPATGRATSYAITLINLTSAITSTAVWGVNRARVWNIFKAGAEFSATVTGLKNGLLVHTAMHVGENFWNLYHLEKWDSEKIEKTISIVPRSFYMLALLFSSSVQTSYALLGLSLGFTAARDLYFLYLFRYCYKELSDKQNLYAVAALGLAGICAIKASSCYQQFQVLQQAAQNFSK